MIKKLIVLFLTLAFLSSILPAAAMDEKSPASHEAQDAQPQRGIINKGISAEERAELDETQQLIIYGPDKPLIDMDHIAKLNIMIEELNNHERLLFNRPGNNFDQTYLGKATFISCKKDSAQNFTEWLVSGNPSYNDPLYGGNILPKEFLYRPEFVDLRQKILSLLPELPENLVFYIDYYFVCNHNLKGGFLSYHQDNVNHLFTTMTNASGMGELNGYMGLGLGPRGQRPIRPTGEPNNNVAENAPIRRIAVLKPEAGAGYRIDEIPRCQCQEKAYPFVAHCAFSWGYSLQENENKEMQVVEDNPPEGVTRNLIIVKVRYLHKSIEGGQLIFHGPSPIYPLKHCAKCSE